MSDSRAFTIESFELKKSSKGKIYGRIKASPGGWMSVWGESDRKFAEEHLGETVQAEVKEDGDFKNASDFKPAEEGAASGERMSKEEWDHKEDRQRVGILYSVHLKQMFEWYRLGLEQADPTKDIFHSYNDLVVHARKAAISDLDWIRNYAVSDVPFEKEEAA